MGKGVIVYDGECRFCRWSVRRIRWLDRRGQFEYLPRQARGAAERFPQLCGSDFNTGLRLIADGGEVCVGADAVYEIYRRMPPFHLLAWLYRTPLLHGFFRMCYALIARYRRLSGRVACATDACAVPIGGRAAPTPEIQDGCKDGGWRGRRFY